MPETNIQSNLKEYYQSSTKYRDDLITHDEAFINPYILLVEQYISKSATVLDIGCGTGLSTRMLRRSGYFTVGADLSPLFLAVEKANEPDLDLVTANALQTPFASGAFDAVTAFEFIEHIPDVDGLLNEIDRLLKPGGYLIFHSPNLISPYLPAFDILRMMLGGDGRPVFAESLPQAFGWLKRNVSLSLGKYFSSSVDFTYRQPDLSENRIGGDADSVYLSNPIDLSKFLKRRNYVIHQRSYAMSLKNRIVAKLTPGFAPYMGLVAQKP